MMTPFKPGGHQTCRGISQIIKARKYKSHICNQVKRTGLTARPLAYKAKILRRVFVDPALNVFAKTILNFGGENVLIVGHSNTVMKLLGAFGADVPFPSSLDEKDYDMLFKITIKDNETREYLRIITAISTTLTRFPKNISPR
ncbi:hypothetical protein ABIB62_000618 [Mucilaginibacter sp. UYP25]